MIELFVLVSKLLGAYPEIPALRMMFHLFSGSI